MSKQFLLQITKKTFIIKQICTKPVIVLFTVITLFH